MVINPIVGVYYTPIAKDRTDRVITIPTFIYCTLRHYDSDSCLDDHLAYKASSCSNTRVWGGGVCWGRGICLLTGIRFRTCPAQNWGEAIDEGPRGPLLPHQPAANGGSSGGWRWLHVWTLDGGGALQKQEQQSPDETAIREPRALPFELMLMDGSWARLWSSARKCVGVGNEDFVE